MGRLWQSAPKARRATPRRATPVLKKSRRVARSHGRSDRRTVKHTSAAIEVKPQPNGINSYAKALRFLASLSDYERLRIVRYNSQNFDLDRMRTLLKKLGNPQDQFRSVHVAGTKGKGSTCAMIAAMLQASGYKVGPLHQPAPGRHPRADRRSTAR